MVTTNSIGKYIGLSPFDTSVRTDITYTVEDVGTLTYCDTNGMDILNTLYIPNGLTKSNYDTDVNNNVNIVTLWDQAGNSVILPDSYLVTQGTAECVQLRNYVLAIPLGELPVGYDTTRLFTAMVDVVRNIIGIDIHLDSNNLVPTSAINYANASDVAAYLTGLKEITPARMGCITQLAQCKEEKAKLQNILDLIKENVKCP